MEATRTNMRAIMVPVAGYTILQFHKYVTFSWLMELILVACIAAPYMPFEKKTVDVGIQTNDECTDIQIFNTQHKPVKIDKILMVSMLVGFVGYIASIYITGVV